MKKIPFLRETTIALSILLGAKNLNAQHSDRVGMLASEYQKKLCEIAHINPLPDTEVKNDSVYIWPNETAELEKHLEACRLPRFSAKDKTENIVNLVQHCVDREIEEHKYSKINEESNWEKIADPNNWSDVGILTESWAGTSKINIVLIPDEHVTENSNGKHIQRVRKIQNEEAKKILERSYEFGSRTFAYEGFDQKERDNKIPSFNTFDTTYAPSRMMEDRFDLEHDDIQTFGLADLTVEEDLKRIEKTQKILEYILFQNHPQTIEQIFEKFAWHLQKETDLDDTYLEEAFKKSIGRTNGGFDRTAKNSLLKYFDSKINQMIFDERNRAAVDYIVTLSNCTKTPTIVVKYGARHFKKEDGKTIQEFLKEKGFSYVIVELPTLQKEFPISSQ